MILRDTWEYVQRKNTKGVVGIIPVKDDGKLVLIQQYRPAVDKQVIELPAGLAGDVPGQEDEDMEIAARRELLEETGYEAQKMEYVFQGVPSSGLSNEHVIFYRATGLKKVAPGGGDEDEDITVIEVEMNRLLAWLEEQQKQGKAIPFQQFIKPGRYSGSNRIGKDTFRIR